MSHDLFREEVAAKGVRRRWMWLSGRRKLLNLPGSQTGHVLWPKPHTKSSFSDSSRSPSLLQFLATTSGQFLPDHLLQPLLHPNLEFFFFFTKQQLPWVHCLLPASSAISFLFSDGSFINQAWMLNSFFCSFSFHQINYSMLFILFRFWRVPLEGWCLLLFSEGFMAVVCLRKPRLKALWCPQGPASGLWNFPSALASHALGFLWAWRPGQRARAAGAEMSSLPASSSSLLLRRPLWEPRWPQFPRAASYTLRSPGSLESVSYLYFPVLHNFKRSCFRRHASNIFQNQNLLGDVYKRSSCNTVRPPNICVFPSRTRYGAQHWKPLKTVGGILCISTC